MTRGKRTDRAEARRRYRAYLQAQTGEEPEAELEAEAPASAGSKARPARTIKERLRPDPLPIGKVSISGAFRAAYRPVHYREDLSLIVPLITKTHAIWPVAVLSAVGLAVVLIRRDPSDFWWQISSQMVLFPIPMMPAMIAGFLAPRATWLAGLIAGFISSMAMLAWYLSGAMPHVVNGHVIGYERLAPGEIWSAVIQLLWLALPTGALLAAVAGWYKRFLALTGPAAQVARVQAAAASQKAAGGQKAEASQKAAGQKAAGSQKAGPRGRAAR